LAAVEPLAPGRRRLRPGTTASGPTTSFASVTVRTIAMIPNGRMQQIIFEKRETRQERSPNVLSA
jgi:hypothetical protein